MRNIKSHAGKLLSQWPTAVTDLIQGYSDIVTAKQFVVIGNLWEIVSYMPIICPLNGQLQLLTSVRAILTLSQSGQFQYSDPSETLSYMHVNCSLNGQLKLRS